MEAAIAYNLVDLALSAPESAFVDVIRAFSAVNRSANPDDPRFSNNMVRCILQYVDVKLVSESGFRCWRRRRDLRRSCTDDQSSIRSIWSSFSACLWIRVSPSRT